MAKTPEVLIIEDERDVGCLMHALLDSEGFNTLLIPTGREAVDFLNQKESQTIRTILLDLSLPDIDGIRVLKWIRESEQHKDTPVIVVTGFGDVLERNQEAAKQVNAVFHKPFDLDKLLEEVNKQTARYRPLK